MESLSSMAKQTKKATRTKRQGKTSRAEGVIDILPARQPLQEDFKAARELLRQRAVALILDLGTRYMASNATELTTVLDAMDELGRVRERDSPARH